MKNKAFSLIELMIAVTIIAMLTAIGIVSYSSATKKSRDAKRKADLEQIRSALEMYRADVGNYPNLVPNISGTSIVNGGITYMNNIPADPKSPSIQYQFFPLTAVPVTDYCLCAYLEADSSGFSSSECKTECSSQTCEENSNSCNYSVQNP